MTEAKKVRLGVAIAILLGLVLLVGGGNLLATYEQVHSQARALQRQEQVTQAAQRKAGAALEKKLCTTFGKLAALKPPPGNPDTNPSRAYLQGQHAILAEVEADISCPGTTEAGTR